MVGWLREICRGSIRKLAYYIQKFNIYMLQFFDGSRSIIGGTPIALEAIE
jgi:hypothetical protein